MTDNYTKCINCKTEADNLDYSLSCPKCRKEFQDMDHEFYKMMAEDFKNPFLAELLKRSK